MSRWERIKKQSNFYKKIDIYKKIGYNKDMKHYSTVIIGGGAAGLFLAANATTKYGKVLLLERGERVGKKLSSTGNGQGNITNARVGEAAYFSVRGDKTQEKQVQGYLSRYGRDELLAFLGRLGGLFLADERGRYYPAGRQASAITDLLRYEVASRGVEVQTGAYVQSVRKVGGRYEITAKTEEGVRTYVADTVVVCTGGKAAKNFGTDGNGYALAGAFSHTTTALYPALVQLKTDVSYTKSLKGIRVMDAKLTAVVDGKPVQTLTGDLIFTDYGVSGDAVFRISSFVADKLDAGKVSLLVDLLPTVEKETLLALLTEKQKNYPQLPKAELLCGILNNQVGRAVMKRYGEAGLSAVVDGVKAFALPVVGSLGFDYAQVTKGGIPLAELDEHLQSRNAEGLYFAGEILDVDGECGGFNLQWAYTSAMVCLEGIKEKICK